MNQLLQNLIESLREELKQYGELLALLDHQQKLVASRAGQELLASINAIDAQAEAIRVARHEREQRRRVVAQNMQLDEEVCFRDLIPALPSDYRPLLQALVEENNQLLGRVQQRARQNQLLLSRAIELMQRFINTLLPGTPATYNHAGAISGDSRPVAAAYEAIG